MINKTLMTILACVLFSLTGNLYAGGDKAAGEVKSAVCVACHGADGKGNEDNPPVGGMDEVEFVKMLQAYKSGEREHAMMKMFVDPLSDQEMADLAAYYAGLGAE